jgi:hypothetical protein
MQHRALVQQTGRSTHLLRHANDLNRLLLLYTAPFPLALKVSLKSFEYDGCSFIQVAYWDDVNFGQHCKCNIGSYMQKRPGKSDTVSVNK